MRVFTRVLGILSSLSCGAQMDSIAVITWVGSISWRAETAIVFRMLLIALPVRRDVCASTESRIRLDSCSLSEVDREGCEAAHDGILGDRALVFEWLEEV